MNAEGGELTLAKAKKTMDEGIPNSMNLVSSNEDEVFVISRFHVGEDLPRGHSHNKGDSAC